MVKMVNFVYILPQLKFFFWLHLRTLESQQMEFSIFQQSYNKFCNIGHVIYAIHLAGQVSVTQSCPTLCDPMDCIPPDSSVHGILQARILEWVAISFSRGSFRPGIEPRSPVLQPDSLPSESHQGSPA